jgi:hypothetical protein
MAESKTTKNIAEFKTVKQGRDKAEESRREELNDLKIVMSIEAGQRLMFRIINELCHVDTRSAVNSGSETYLREGERNIGRILKTEVAMVALGHYQRLERKYINEQLDEELLAEPQTKEQDDD